MKRLNVKLLIWMVVTTAVVLGLIVGLHTFQVRRNSGSYLTLAQQAEEDKNYEDAIRFYRQYLSYHDDDVEVNVRFASMLTDLAEQGESPGALRIQAFGALQRALQLDEGNTEIRGRMAKFLLTKMGRIDEAISHFEDLRRKEPENAEWEMLLAACRRALGKYSEAVELLRSAITHKPDDVAPYAQLAVILHDNMDQGEEAFAVLDAMVEANPDNAQARLVRYEFRARAGQSEAAAEDLAKALELDPDSIDVLLAASRAALMKQDFAAAREHLERAIAAHPEDYRTYLTLADIERYENRPAEAVAQLERGLESAERRELLWIKLCETHLNQGNVAGAQKSIDEMQKIGIADEHLERFRAQALIVERKWAAALRTLNALRPKVVGMPQMLVPIDLYRAQCFAGLGQADLQIEALRQVLFHATDPQIVLRARHQLAAALQSTGQIDEAMDELASLAAAGDQLATITMFQHSINQQLRLPAEQRDWRRCDELLQQLEARLENVVQLKALQADYKIRRGDFAAARELLDTAIAEHPKETTLWLAAVDIESQEHDLEAGQRRLEEARAALGDTVQLRVAEIMLLGRRGDEAAKESLNALESKFDQYPEQERAALYQTLANVYGSLGDRQRAYDLYQQAAKLAPDDIGARLNAFRLARDIGDDALMQRSLQQIKEGLGDNNTYWQYGEAARIVTAVAQNKRPLEDLAEARKLIEASLAQRPNWAPLHSLLGEIEQRQGNLDAAIVHFQRGFDLGDQSVQTVRSVVSLLVIRGRAAEADALVNQIPRAREILGPKVSAMIDLMLGKTEEGLANAAQAVELAQDDYATQLWYGSLMERAGKFAEAEAALTRARDLADNVPDVWLSLIRHYVVTNKPDAAKQAIVEAEGRLPAENQARTMAAAYELVKDNEKAAALYEAALKEAPNDLNLLRQMARFYQSSNPQRSAELLSNIINTGLGAGPLGEQHVRWARRTLAQFLASSRSAADVRNAIAFLDSTAPQIKPDLDDMSVKAGLLSVFTDVESKSTAIKLLNEVAAQDPERLDEQLMLAMLFNRSGDWASAKGTMLTLLNRRPDNPQLILAFAEMLLQHREAADAESWLDKCAKLGGDKLPAYALARARLYAFQDQPDLAINSAKSVVTPPLAPEQVPQLRIVAMLLEGMAETASNPEPYYEAAGEMYREYVSEVPDESLVLARFVGLHGDIDEALNICEEAIPKRGAEQAIRASLTFVRARRQDMTDAQRQRIQGWIDAAVAENNKDGSAQILLADFYDSRGEYDKCESVYRDLLKNKSTSVQYRATVLNNLAYLQAVRHGRGDEALQLIEEAIQLVGPISELLDTRGMVHIARGDSKQAVQDLRRAVADSATPIKLFHLAQALVLDNDTVAAGDAFRQAEVMGLKASEISSFERKNFDDLQSRFPS